MKLSVKIPNKKARPFLLGYSLYLFFQILNYSFYSIYIPGVISRIIILMCLGLFVVGEVAYGKLYKGKITSYIVVIVLMLICAYLNFVNLSVVIIVVFFGRNIDFKQICRVTIFVTIVGLLFVYFSTKLGIITEYFGYRGDGTRRSYLGFRYVLFGPGFLINILGAYIYLKKADISKFFRILIALFSLAVYIVTDARLSFILAILMISFTQFGKKRMHKEGIMSKLIIPIFPLALVFSLLTASLYSAGNSRWRILDAILAKRLQYNQRSLLLYGIRLLGNPEIDWAGFSISEDGSIPVHDANMVYVDNAYIHILQRYGVIFTALILIALTYVMYILYKKHDYLMQVLFVLIAIHGLIDNQILYVCFNVFLFAMYNEIVSYARMRGRPQILKQNRKLYQNLPG